MTESTCPSCYSAACTSFYKVRNVPTNSCLLVDDREAAMRFPRGDIELAFCRNCGFIFNAALEARRTVYSALYEETQGFSPTFNAFHHRLVEDLVGRYGIQDKDILEIGCGKGEFLTLMCRAGGNRGVGYDPSFIPERHRGDGEKIRFERRLFDETTDEKDAFDVICCKMTLEHISETWKFIRAIRRVASGSRGNLVFIQVPDVRRIFKETAFWDIYYEHCSYFSPSSLSHLMRSCGFEVLRTSTDYGDQYLMIEARAVDGFVEPAPSIAEQAEFAELAEGVAGFAAEKDRVGAAWSEEIRRCAALGERIVVWGSGSKAVSFLTTLGLGREIAYVVDVNPYRHGKFMPGTGQEIASPSFLASFRPDKVIVMNPVYRREVEQDLTGLGCSPELLCLGDPPPAAVPPPTISLRAGAA